MEHVTSIVMDLSWEFGALYVFLESHQEGSVTDRTGAPAPAPKIQIQIQIQNILVTQVKPLASAGARVAAEIPNTKYFLQVKPATSS